MNDGGVLFILIELLGSTEIMFRPELWRFLVAQVLAEMVALGHAVATKWPNPVGRVAMCGRMGARWGG